MNSAALSSLWRVGRSPFQDALCYRGPPVDPTISARVSPIRTTNSTHRSSVRWLSVSATTISGVIAPDPSDTSPELQPPKVTAKPPGEEHFTAHGVESGIAMIENLFDWVVRPPNKSSRPDRCNFCLNRRCNSGPAVIASAIKRASAAWAFSALTAARWRDTSAAAFCAGVGSDCPQFASILRTKLIAPNPTHRPIRHYPRPSWLCVLPARFAISHSSFWVRL
jgi:hypothetical protein